MFYYKCLIYYNASYINFSLNSNSPVLPIGTVYELSIT